MSEQLWYYIDYTAAQQGPITIPQLQALVASGEVTPATIVWTEALGEQWIPASNVEGLFPEDIPVKPDPNTASVAVQAPHEMPNEAAMAKEIEQAAAPPVPAPALRAPGAVAQQPQQPQAAPTTPMLASTPTTQPIAGTVAGIPGVPAPTAAQEATPAQVAQAPSNPVAGEAPAPAKSKSILGIILLLLGLGAAGYGGYLFSTDGGTGLSYGLLGGGGVVAILGLIMTLKGKKASEPAIIGAGAEVGARDAQAAGGFSAMGGAAAPVAAAPAGTFDLSAAADVAPIPAGTAPVAIKANPLMPSAPAADAAAKPSPFAGVTTATKPNPLLAAGAAIAPQNKLNTTVPAKPAEPAEPAPTDPS